MRTPPGDSDEPKTNGPADERARTRKDTPIVSIGGPEGAANRIAQLRRTLGRTGDLCEQVERLVRSRGFDPQARAALIELADHFEQNLTTIAAGTGRVLRRLAELG
jgi:hypothetical protein